MKIELKSIPIRDLITGYSNNPDTGVRAYGGSLDVRPPYQREFRYDEKQKRAVIETIMKGFPLNIMYWSEDGDGTFEMIDGQQRTLSICEFYTHDFNIVDKDRGVLFFNTLTDDEKQAFLDYELTVYFCSGTDKEKLDWFRIINIAGEKLTDQELRNAVYAGTWLSDAKKRFSFQSAPSHLISSLIDSTNSIFSLVGFVSSKRIWNFPLYFCANPTSDKAAGTFFFSTRVGVSVTRSVNAIFS